MPGGSEGHKDNKQDEKTVFSTMFELTIILYYSRDPPMTLFRSGCYEHYCTRADLESVRSNWEKARRYFIREEAETILSNSKDSKIVECYIEISLRALGTSELPKKKQK
jgi:hypothetical protein